MASRSGTIPAPAKAASIEPGMPATGPAANANTPMAVAKIAMRNAATRPRVASPRCPQMGAAASERIELIAPTSPIASKETPRSRKTIELKGR